ncbi:MAG TPA: hypothetical protein VM492_02715 [Sumerlaeia bacterium]|nr:hypothetical protein [Sumerlaeia bacterium]
MEYVISYGEMVQMMFQLAILTVLFGIYKETRKLAAQQSNKKE